MRLLNGQKINRISGIGLIVLSLIALVDVAAGYLQAPQADEGTGAHIFQLAIVALVPMVLLFLATADWSRPLRSLRPLAFAAAALMIAFGALYYLEHYWWAAGTTRNAISLSPPSSSALQFSQPGSWGCRG